MFGKLTEPTNWGTANSLAVFGNCFPTKTGKFVVVAVTERCCCGNTCGKDSYGSHGLNGPFEPFMYVAVPEVS